MMETSAGVVCAVFAVFVVCAGPGRNGSEDQSAFGFGTVSGET